MQCPCCSLLPYEMCCAPLHLGLQKASSPLALMRSRYSAYVLSLHNYILETYVAEEQAAHTLEDIQKSFEGVKWLRLEIERVQANRVSFAAFYERSGRGFVIRENSSFRKDDDGWKYWGQQSQVET